LGQEISAGSLADCLKRPALENAHMLPKKIMLTTQNAEVFSYTISKKWVLQIQAVLFVCTHHPWHMLARSIYQEFVVYPLPGSMLLSPNVSS